MFRDWIYNLELSFSSLSCSWDLKSGFFLFFTTLSWYLAWRAVTSRAPIHGILSLICLFVVSAYLFITYFALEFIGVLFLVIYVGAVAVLFVFVVIILPSRGTQLIFGPSSKLLWSLVGIVVVLSAFAIILSNPVFLNDSYFVVEEMLPYWDIGAFGGFENDASLLLEGVDVYSLGQYIYRVNSLPLVASAVLLFVALVVAIIICDDRE